MKLKLSSQTKNNIDMMTKTWKTTTKPPEAEGWKEHPVYKGYYGHADGIIYSSRGKGRILRPRIDRYNYLKVNINGKTVSLHRFIVDCFLPADPFKPEVNHINSVRTDNRLKNLERCNSSENAIHGVTYGNRKGKLRSQGEELIGVRPEAIIFIYCSGLWTQRELAIIFQVSQNTISKVIRGRSWKHLQNLKHTQLTYR